MNQPATLPPLPPVPTFTELQARTSLEPCQHCEPSGRVFHEIGKPCPALPIEAVREPAKECWPMPNSLNEAISDNLFELLDEPAKDQPPHPGAPLDSLEGLANLRFYEGKAFTKSFTVGGNEPAKEPAAGEAEDWKPFMPPPERVAETMRLLDEVFVTPEPTGVEARVCEDGWRPIETAPRDGTPFVWLHYVTVLSTPVEYKPYATVVRRHWLDSNTEKTGDGFWMGQYTSYGDQELERGWWQPLPPPPTTEDHE